METPSKQKIVWPWIVGGCAVLVVLACLFTAAIGAGGFLIANRTAKTVQTTKQLTPAGMTAKTAVLQDMQGWVEVESDKGDWSPAEQNQLLTSGQHVRTGKLSSASLVFNDGSQASLAADSEISIDTLDAQKDGKQRAIVLTQVSGESTHQVIPNKRSDSRYEVLSPTGTGLAKGTEFRVVVTPEQAAYYYVLEGVVTVSSMETTVMVNPGFMTVIYYDQPPIAPVQSISVEGLVSQTGSQWTIAGSTFTVTSKTVITGSPQVGDWVIAKGHVDEKSQNIADWIILLHSALTNQFSLTGKVEAIDDGEWKVNGQAIDITEKTEIDEGNQVGDAVRVEGLILTGGSLQASKIERLDEAKGMAFEFTGMVQKTEGAVFTISGTQVTTNENTAIAKDLKTGDLVEVKGWIQSDGTWLAKSITLVEGEDEEREFEFTGKIESTNPWNVAGIGFETRDYTVIAADLKAGEVVRVEGEINANGVWIAAKIERLNTETNGKMIVIGTVVSTNPWVISGISLTLTPNAVISTDIKVGMLVRVELVLQPNGVWLVTKIEPLSTLVWFPGCMDVIATVMSIDGNQIQLLNWPVMTIEDGAKIEGTLTPNSIIRMRVCFDQTMVIKITYIIIVQPGDTEPPVGEGEEGGKVTVCHKPGGKKGGHTLTISRSALPAHLGHGDYEGSCK